MPSFRKHTNPKTGKHAPSLDRSFNKEELRFILTAITYPNIPPEMLEKVYTVGQLRAYILGMASLKIE